MFDGDELGFLVGWLDGNVEGIDDGPEDFSTHSRLPTKSSSFSPQQHFAVSQIPVFLEFMKHSETKWEQDAS